MDTLEELKATVKDLDRLAGELKIVNAQWSTWNAWARQQDGYIAWAHENAIEGKELRAFENKGVKVSFEWDEGAPLLALRRLVWHQKDQCRQRLSVLLEKAWNAEEQPLSKIAQAYYLRGKEPASPEEQAKAENATYRIVSRSPWFKNRRQVIDIRDAPSLR